MPLTQVLSRLMAGVDLDMEAAHDLMSEMCEGTAPAEQIVGVLVALQIKGPTAQELAGMAGYLREKVTPLTHDCPDLVDTCGTGGGRATFNLSTGAAIVAASAGVKVAKHGNRSVTSKCGSADVLEALGVSLHADPERLAHLLNEVGIVFLFAPHHHGSLKAVGAVRRSLGVRTVFNQLGPLANPAGASRLLIGVYERAMVRPMAEALAILGTEMAYVVHSEDGMDEVSPCDVTWFSEVSQGAVTDGKFRPNDFLDSALSPLALSPGLNIKDSATILRSALDFSNEERALALVPNAALALVLAGLAETPSEGAEMALRSLKSGASLHKLDQMVEASSK